MTRMDMIRIRRQMRRRIREVVAERRSARLDAAVENPGVEEIDTSAAPDHSREPSLIAG